MCLICCFHTDRQMVLDPARSFKDVYRNVTKLSGACGEVKTWRFWSFRSRFLAKFVGSVRFWLQQHVARKAAAGLRGHAGALLAHQLVAQLEPEWVDLACWYCYYGKRCKSRLTHMMEFIQCTDT